MSIGLLLPILLIIFLLGGFSGRFGGYGYGYGHGGVGVIGLILIVIAGTPLANCAPSFWMWRLRCRFCYSFRLPARGGPSDLIFRSCRSRRCAVRIVIRPSKQPFQSSRSFLAGR
jgi:hypothetical protein